jgi:NADH dehydrogenase
VYTLRDLIQIAQRLAGKRRLIVPVPIAIAELLVRFFELLPNPPLTTGQVDLLRADNVAAGSQPGFRELNFQPRTVEEIAPSYISYARGPEPD